MERKLQERMIGAVVLIVVLVVLGPVILSGGGRQEPAGVPAPAQRDGELRSHTFSLDRRQPPGAPAAVASRAEADAAVTPSQPQISSTQSSPPVAIVQPAIEPAREVPEARPAPRPVSKAVDDAARTVGASPAASPVSSLGNWVVQVGTFGQKGNADRLVTQLKKNGFDAFVSATERSGKPLYRVRVGPASSRDAATALAGRLMSNGQSGQVVSQ